MGKLTELGALEAAQKIKSGEITSFELTQDVIDSKNKKDGNYNAYIRLNEEKALKGAKQADEDIKSGKVSSPLAGVPVAVKDNICTKGEITSCASKMLYNFDPIYDATVIKKVRAAGMVTCGKVNMDEFAMGSTTETSYFGATKNPWNTKKVPGGSSGGAAASVSARESVIALGSDTGGSIRQPCSFCGVTGLKPTYGSVSRYGLIAYASSLDQIGPIAKSASDVSALYSIISGKDEKDGTSVDDGKIDLNKILASDNLKGKKIGIPRDFFGDGIEPDVEKKVKEAAKVLENLGADVEEFDMPIVKYAIPTYYIIACAEACSNLSRFDGIKYGYKAKDTYNLRDIYFKSRSEGFGLEVKKRIMLGNFVLSSGYFDAYYNKALKAKGLIVKAFGDAFQKYDFILGPVAPTTALELGKGLSDPLQMYLGDIYTVMINIAGLPSLALPCGFDMKNMPVGMQFIGRPFDEQTILESGVAYQKLTDFHTKTPIRQED